MRYDLPVLEDTPVATGESTGAPLMLALDDIDEDPNQPRHEFDAGALRELAATIAERGVRQPVSVREHPEQPGRWMLNFGARRLRASRLAGKTDIPAFVDAQDDSYDQVIENEQREGLKPLELALFMQRRLAAGDNQAEIARRLGKSRGYLTFVCALIDAPDWLLDLYRRGRSRGATELYELRKLHESHQVVIEQWLTTRSSISRADVQAFKEVLESRGTTQQARADARTKAPSASVEPQGADRSTPAPSAPPPVCTSAATAGTGAAALWASYEGADVRIDLGSVPAEDGRVFVLSKANGERICAPASHLRLLRVSKG